jgi:YVTN family beta-propeller protein
VDIPTAGSNTVSVIIASTNVVTTTVTVGANPVNVVAF